MKVYKKSCNEIFSLFYPHPQNEMKMNGSHFMFRNKNTNLEKEWKKQLITLKLTNIANTRSQNKRNEKKKHMMFFTIISKLTMT